MTDENSVAGEVQQNQDQLQERKFSQADLNEVAGKIRAEERERMLRAQQNQSVQPAAQPIDHEKMVNDAVSKKLEEQRQLVMKEQANQNAQRFAQDFDKKLSAAKENYSDFDDTVKPFINDLAQNSDLLLMLHAADNTGDMVYDLAKNPHKFAQLSHLSTLKGSDGRPSHSAIKAMHELSTSIKKNKEAKEIPQANEPVSQVKSSSTGTDSGKKTVDDIRRQNYLRA